MSKLTLETAHILEKKEEFRFASQTLYYCLLKINQYRDRLSLRGVDSSLDVFLPNILTCSNSKIRDTIIKMKENYVEVKNKINREIRAKEKEANNKAELTYDEAQEEEYEILVANKNFLNDDNKDKEYFKTIDLSSKPIKDLDLIINALHCEVAISFIRFLKKYFNLFIEVY